MHAYVLCVFTINMYLRVMLMSNQKKVVFSKSYCPYCRASKDLLNQLGAKYYALELDQIG